MKLLLTTRSYQRDYTHYSRRVKGYYNHIYAQVQNYELKNWRASYFQRIVEELKIGDGVKENHNQRLLDIGVGGEGGVVIECARRGLCSYGIDISEKAIEKTQELAKKVLSPGQQKLVKLKVASAEQLPFPDHYFSKICSVSVLEYVENDKRALDEISRVTRKNGRVFLCVSNKRPLPLRLNEIIIDWKKPKKLRLYNAYELIDELTGRGFRFETLTYHGHYPKILQFFLSQVFPSMQKRDSKLWWWLEKWDLALKDSPLAFMFSLTMIKL